MAQGALVCNQCLWKPWHGLFHSSGVTAEPNPYDGQTSDLGFSSEHWFGSNWSTVWCDFLGMSHQGGVTKLIR